MFSSPCNIAIAIILYTVKIKCAYHTNGVIYDTVGVPITLYYGDQHSHSVI